MSLNNICNLIDSLFNKQPREIFINPRFISSEPVVLTREQKKIITYQLFDKERMSCPKQKKNRQFITARITYLERTNDQIIVKLSKKRSIILNQSGTWRFSDV